MSQTTETTTDMKAMANAIRFLSMDAIVQANDGHPGTPLGGADIATALFSRQLKFDPNAPRWPDRDRFVHSAGHGSMLIYSALHLCGYEALNIDQIRNFRVLGSNTPGHPEYHMDSGIETTTGPLGQGIGNAVGMAIAERVLNNRFGDEIVDHYTYAYTGDGCLMEGIAAEIIALAGHLRLGKLIFLWDDNRMTDDGVIEQAVSEDQVTRFTNNGWHVQRVDGHDPEAIAKAIEVAKQDDRPSMIACRTLIGFGIPRIQDDRAAHGGRITKEDTDAARANLGWSHEPFQIPNDLQQAWRRNGERGAAAAFDAGLTTVIHTSRGERVFGDTRERLAFGEQISAFLVDVVRGLPCELGFLVSKGGITSNEILSRGLELHTARVLGQVMAGCSVVRCPDTHPRFPGMPVVIFPGNVGADNGLVEVLARMSGPYH
ncbi:MAG: hypothetical protein KDI68_08355 [Gammaproteobacteria bacterium]|nr:hypothetical protein [Gammaproteobacteria bacterium]